MGVKTEDLLLNDHDDYDGDYSMSLSNGTDLNDLGMVLFY